MNWPCLVTQGQSPEYHLRGLLFPMTSFPIRAWINIRSSPIYKGRNLCLSWLHFHRSRNKLSFLLFSPYLIILWQNQTHYLKSNRFTVGAPCPGSDSCLTGPLPCSVLILVVFRHKSSQRPLFLVCRIRAPLLQQWCIWDTSPLLFRPTQTLNGAVLTAEYPFSSPFHMEQS